MAMPLNEGDLRSTGPSFAVIRIQRVRPRDERVGKSAAKTYHVIATTHTFSDRQAVGYYVRGNRGNIERPKTSRSLQPFPIRNRSVFERRPPLRSWRWTGEWRVAVDEGSRAS